jgi:hypothetical protein
VRRSAYNILRTRVGDAQGGWTITTHVDAVVYGEFDYNMPDTEFICSETEDLRLDDVIDAGGRWYIVRERFGVDGSGQTKWRIELADRPQVAPSTTVAATTTLAGTTTAGI